MKLGNWRLELGSSTIEHGIVPVCTSTVLRATLSGSRGPRLDRITEDGLRSTDFSGCLPSSDHGPGSTVLGGGWVFMEARAVTTAIGADVPWYRTVTREQWRVLLAAKFGWMLDAMDFMLYTMAVGQLRMYFGFGDDTAGMLGTVTLVMSGVGGTIFGYVADRFGRTRALMGTILIFSLASLGAATSQSVMQLLFWRAVLGIGMGGEWASGAVLVSETWPAHLRNKAISIMQSGWALGYMMASISA